MKVVLFCGGLGMRLRDYADNVPKPMVRIGSRPILWHLMKYYSHYGLKDFIICLGYKGEVIKNYFLNYEESVSNDFVFSGAGREVELLSSDIHDWRITFADTGSNTSVGERLLAVQKYLGDDPVFLANYADGLTDLHLPDQLDRFRRSGKVVSFLCVKPNMTQHFVDRGDDGTVRGIHPISRADIRVNGGFFAMRREIFEYMRKGEDLVDGAFPRLIRDGELLAHDYDGFWLAVDTAQDKQRVDSLYEAGNPLWEVWNQPSRPNSVLADQPTPVAEEVS